MGGCCTSGSSRGRSGTLRPRRQVAVSRQPVKRPHSTPIPGLMAPINGVTFELFVEVSARASTITEAEFAALIAQHGVNMEGWLQADKAWTARMQSDKSGALANRYTELFGKLGVGRFGAAAQAAAATGYDGTAAGGGEPIPFERFCEMAGAIAGWSIAGQDSNALIEQKFGVSMLDYCNISTWWYTQMTADMDLMSRHSARVEYYQNQYAKGVTSPTLFRVPAKSPNRSGLGPSAGGPRSQGGVYLAPPPRNCFLADLFAIVGEFWASLALAVQLPN